MKRGFTVFLYWIGCQFTLYAQAPTREQFVGTWIGLRISYDQHVDRPYPVCLKLAADSTYMLSLLDEKGPQRRSTWSVAKETIRLDTNTYKLNQWALRGDELRLTGEYPITFRRLINIAIDSATVRQSLSGYKWLTDSLVYHFHSDGTACIENSETGEVAVHCWRLAQLENSIFLVIKGKLNECDGNFQYPIQLTQVTSETITGFSGGRSMNQLTLQRGAAIKTDQPCQPKGFQPCNSYVFSSFNLYPYFSFQHGRLHEIRQVVEREYKPISIAGQSGLIRFKFIVNCRGEAGRFEMLTVDENYQKFTFSHQITNQLSAICQNKLTNWEPGKTNHDQTPVDTFCLLTFRLKDGLITDIFP